MMIGVGETWDEILQTMDDLRAVDCDILTIGQYLQPTRKHLTVEKYYTPDEFELLKEEGLKRGFSHVESGPLFVVPIMHGNRRKQLFALTSLTHENELEYAVRGAWKENRQ